MQILIKLKEDSKHNRLVTGIGTFEKGKISAIDSKYFDESIMEKVSEESEPEKEIISEPEEPKEETPTEEELKDTRETVEEKEVLSEEELFKLNKKQQSEILKKLGVKEIPRLEKERVAMIIELQK